MTKKTFMNQIIIFISALFCILFSREFISFWMIENNITSYKIHTIASTIANFILILISWILIRRNKLFKLAGIKDAKLQKWHLLIFPSIYLGLLSLIFMDDISMDLSSTDLLIYLLYSLSIGFAEEFSIRGFLQSHLIQYFGNSKKAIFNAILVSSLFFGCIHFINFESGIYGELSQVCYATFIGFMFGALLFVTKRIYPLIIIHTVFDFFMDLDTVGVPIIEKISETTSLESAIIGTLLTLPCFIYGLIIVKKQY